MLIAPGTTTNNDGILSPTDFICWPNTTLQSRRTMAIWTFTRRDCKRRPHRDKAVAVIWVHLFGSYSGKVGSIHLPLAWVRNHRDFTNYLNLAVMPCS